MSEKRVLHALQGHVKHQGLPVAGVVVRVFHAHTYTGSIKNEPELAQVTTGNKGEYSFQLPSGTYTVEIVPNGSTRFLKERLSQIELNSNTTCNISLKTGTLLKGSIQTRTGERLGGCEVVALGIEPSSYAATSVVDSNGVYNLILPKGRFHVASRCLINVPPDSHEAAVDHEEKIDTNSTIGHTNGLVEFPFVCTNVGVIDIIVDDAYEVVLPELLKFQGEVRDVFGQAVVGATCRFYPNTTSDQFLLRELALFGECITDSQGRFSVRVEPGLYDIEIIPAAGSTHFALKQSNIRISSDTFRKFVLEEGHKLRGEVVYEDAALSGCLVRLQQVGGTGEYITKTDAQGQFAMGVPGGSYKMVVVAHPKNAPTITIDGAEHTGIAPWAKMIVVGGDTHVSVALKSGTALRGRVQDDSGQARSGMHVSVFPDIGQKIKREEADLSLAHSITDIDGRYSIFLAPGKYLLVVHKDFENATPIEVGGEPVNSDITWHGWCQVKFELSGEDDQKIPRCQVEYRPYGEKEEEESEAPQEHATMPRGYVLTDDEGKCQITIPQGVYSFKFNPPTSGSYEQKHIRQLSISSDLVRKVVLSLKDTV